LPNTAGAQETLIIGLIGANYSGKSHYVAALVKRLQEQVGTDLVASLSPVSDESQDRYNREFRAPLFDNSLELPVTVGTPPPLIYDLTLSVRGENRNRGVTLTLYDTAGENLDRAETVRQMVDYLRPASGIIFLIDPLQVPSVREALPPQVPLPQLDGSADPHSVISRVLQVLKEGGVMNDTLATPIAVALTKCDVLRDAGLIAENRLWSTDKSHVGCFDNETHDDMTGMMGSYIQRWSPAAYNTVVRHFSRHAFFGISATGCAPDKKTRRYKFISPWRVEDPLLWLLAELGVIPRR
jgi:GTPase SAR1 family protein